MTSVTRPRKKSALMAYSDLNKESIKVTFNLLWESIKSTMVPSQRIRIWNKHVKACWEKETPEVQEEISKQADKESEKALADWRKKALFTGSPEDLSQ